MGPVGIASLSAALVVAALVVALVVWLRRDRRVREELAAARAEAAELRDRLTELERVATRQQRVTSIPAEFLITDAGTHRSGDEPIGAGVPDRLVLSATLGEPLVKAVAFSHGVRRALSAESRNRIRFAMRQELRRTRRRRRREMKEAWRRMRAEERASGDAA
jgi:hypothetical protein